MRTLLIAFLPLSLAVGGSACAVDATGPNCSNGKPCGNTCIEKTDTCYP